MKLETIRMGAGPRTTVLLHGFLGMGRNLRSVAQAWGAADPSRTFLLPDLTGHGASQPLPEGTDLRAMARDLLETLRAEGLPLPAELVGHSQGGRVALALAELEPAAVASVALLDIGPGPIDTGTTESGGVVRKLITAPARATDRRELRAALTSSGLSVPLAEWLLMNVVADEGGGVRWRFDREALAALHKRVNAQDLWPVVEARRVPIRCVRGERSPYVSDADKARLEAAGCPVETLAGAGHYVHTDAPEALLAWLRRGG